MAAFAGVPCARVARGESVACDRLDAPRRAVASGKKRVRALMYGAGGAFRGLASPRERIGELVRMSGGGFGGFKGGGGAGGGDEDDEEWNVDPSWGAAPGVHVVMRGRCDEAYRLLVANLVAVGVGVGKGGAFVGVGDPTVPVVILLSWMGAQQKHLEKYRAYYEGMGYEVHCVFNDLKTAVFPPASRAQANRIGEFISGQPDDRPVFVHAFSIGTGIYGLLLDSLRHDMEKLDRITKKVTGVVFDSGPAPIFPTDVAKGLNTVCPLISRAVWEPIAGTLFFLTKARQSFGRSEDALRKLQLPIPQLYFYSLDDKVIPNIHHAVEEFIDKNKQRGLEVYKKWWDKSIHASHLKVHKEEYLANLNSFIHRCMEVRSQQRENATLPAPVLTK